MASYNILNPGKPDENTVEPTCIPGPDWKAGTLEPTLKPEEVCFEDEGTHDEVKTIDCGQYGSDYEPKGYARTSSVTAFKP